MGSQKIGQTIFLPNNSQRSNRPLLKKKFSVHFGVQNNLWSSKQFLGFNPAPIVAKVFHLQPPAAMTRNPKLFEENNSQSSIPRPLNKELFSHQTILEFNNSWHCSIPMEIPATTASKEIASPQNNS